MDLEKLESLDISEDTKLKAEMTTRIKILVKREPLTTKKALELLLQGTLRSKVCRYCMNVCTVLNDLDQIMQIGGDQAWYKVSVRDMIAAIHPFKVADDPNFPHKICEKCLDKAVQSYLFAQQCERSERAMRNCFDDLYNKLVKLDPIERVKKRGRQKLNPNHNILYTEHKFVIDYASPIRHLINSGSVSLNKEPIMSELECPRCFQVLPDVESLVNHEILHPKSMWFHCRVCGKSFPKKFQLKRHSRTHLKNNLVSEKLFECKECSSVTDDHNIHLQHIEKHKFKKALQLIVNNQMDKLCAICMENSTQMTEMGTTICLHGGYPELTGEQTVYNILGSSLPEMSLVDNYTGTRICSKCLDHALISYVFANRVRYIRQRLNLSLTSMLNCLNELTDVKDKVFIEIAENGIMPIGDDEFDENLLLEDHEIDERKLKVQVLEDEFRLKSESDSDDDVSKEQLIKSNKLDKLNTKTKLVNGYQKNHKRKSIVKFTCPLCIKHFISDYFLTKHLVKHELKKVNCKLCSVQFKSKFHLNEHVKIAHLLKEKNYSACHCGRVFKTETKLKKHENRHKWFCDLCDKTFNTQENYNTHLQRHFRKLITKHNKHICSFCELDCLNENELSLHINKTHLHIKPYGCDMCDKQLYTQQNLRSHKKIHELPSKETCEFCSETLKSRKRLVVHIRKHMGIKPHQCMLCTQTFYSEGLCIKHMNKWHGGRFCCQLCKKVFVNKTGLKTHVNSAHLFF